MASDSNEYFWIQSSDPIVALYIGFIQTENLPSRKKMLYPQTYYFEKNEFDTFKVHVVKDQILISAVHARKEILIVSPGLSYDFMIDLLDIHPSKQSNLTDY